MVIIEHSVCLTLGGTYEPAYHLTVTALPHLIGPVSNLRNTILIQGAIRDDLDIPESRGVVKFEMIPEDSLGTNGGTVRDEITQLEKKTSASSDGIIKNFSRTMSRRIKPASRVNTAPPAASPSTNAGQDTARSEDTDMPGLVSLPLDPGRANISPVAEQGEAEGNSDAEPEAAQKPQCEEGTERKTEEQEVIVEKEDEEQKLSKNRVLKKYKSIKKLFMR